MIKLKLILTSYIFLFLTIGCRESKPATDNSLEAFETVKSVNLVWTLLDQDSYFTDCYHEIKFNMSLTKDSIAIFIDYPAYSLIYSTPIQEVDWRTISDIIKGRRKNNHSYSEVYRNNCLARIGDDLIEDSIVSQLVEIAVALSPFLPEIDSLASQPIPKFNPLYCRVDSTSWQTLEIRKEQWWPICNDFNSDGRAALYDKRTKPTKEIPVEITLNSAEIDSLNNILFRCNPRGYFCYTDSVALDLDTITFVLDIREFFKCYAWPSDIPKIYNSLIDFGYNRLSTQ